MFLVNILLIILVVLAAYFCRFWLPTRSGSPKKLSAPNALSTDDALNNPYLRAVNKKYFPILKILIKNPQI